MLLQRFVAGAELGWITRVVRDPLDVLEAKIRGGTGSGEAAEGQWD
jgi:hypothetical protein